MKLTRLQKLLAGLALIVAGFGLFLDNLGIISFHIWDLWPLILVYFGFRAFAKGKRLTGGILTALGALFVLQVWFNIGIDDVFHLLIPIGLIFLGFRMIRSRQEQRPPISDLSASMEPAPGPKPESAAVSSVRPEVSVPPLEREAPPHARVNMRVERPLRPDGAEPKYSRSSLIGDFHLTSGRFELSHMSIWHGIGNVVIDLSRAVIHEEETTLNVQGWVGDITIYVPVDLPVAITAEVTLGDLEVFGHRQGGLNRYVVMRSDHFDGSSPKVTLNISLIVGDIDVKYI